MLEGSERAEAKMPMLVKQLPQAGKHPQRFRGEAAEHHREQEPGDAGRQKLFDRLVNHRVGKAGMVAAGARLHLDPDDSAAHQRGDRPTGEKDDRCAGRIVEPEELRDRGQKREGTGRGHRLRAIAAKRRSRRNLAADGEDVGQRFVEVPHHPPCAAHLATPTVRRPPDFASQSIRKRKAIASGDGPSLSGLPMRRCPHPSRSVARGRVGDWHETCYHARMLNYVLRRLLATIPVMAVVALFVFSLLYIAPGDPAAVIAGDQATPADVERIRASLGLDRPFLVRFGEWVWQILHGNLGTSIFTNLPVSTMIAQRLEPTLSLMAITLTFSVAVAVPIGVLAAWKVGTWIDRLVMAFAVFGFSVPVFVIGYLLAYIFALQLEWLPVQGYTPLAEGIWPWLENLILPALALGCVYIALIARMTRAAMLEVLGQDYIRTARAKGIGQYGILFIHALKNAAVPIVTVIGIGIALLIGGAVVTESVFAIPGLGRLTVDAILRRDYPVIQGVVLLFSFVYVIVNLLIDLTYTVLDPRIRY